MTNVDLEREELERLVALRTAELERLNRQLHQEIAERKHVEDALRLQRDFIDLVIQTSPNLIFVKDKDGFFLLVNQAMADSYGMSRDALMHKNNAEVHERADEVEAYARVDQEVIRKGKTRILEEPFSTPTGEVRWYQTIKTPLVQPDGTVHVLGISTDITELKRAQEAADQQAELERLVAELEAKNDELERFTYTVSHDLKSPLVTIKGFAGLLQQDVAGGDADCIAQDLAQIQAAADKMERLLDDLLQLSRVGRRVHPSEPIPLDDLAREAVDLVAGQISQRGVTVEIAPNMPVVVGDRLRLLEVLQNLIDNAVKFMGEQPAPRVEIGARQEDERIVCYVRDNGIGIDPAYHRKVFGLFERLDGQTEGTGIGLALVKRIVEIHEGTTWVESDGLGRGSTFYIALPRNPS